MKEVDASADPLARFAARLLETPALRPLPALKKEDQALQFLVANGPQLQPVLGSLGLDMSRGWQGAAEAVARAVRAEASRRLQEELSALARTRLTLSFFPVLGGGRPAPAGARDELASFFGRLPQHPISRGALAGSMAVALPDIIERYIMEAWERKKYIYVEVTRVQRLSITAVDMAELLRFVVMVRPAAYLLSTPGERLDRNAGYAPLQEAYLSKILPTIAGMLRTFPAQAVAEGLRSTLLFTGSEAVDAISRLAAVFAFRGRALSPALVVDRGADTPDASWLNVTRKNARWHGLDQRILDEMYTIAAENGW